MQNVSRSVRLVALLLPLAGWTVPKEPISRDSSPGRTGASISIIRRDVGSIKRLEAPDHAVQARVMEAYGGLPLSFEANRGQMDSNVKFFSRGSGYSIFITPAEAVLSLSSGPRQETKGPEAGKNIAALNPPASPDGRQRSAVLRMKLFGANPRPELTGLDELPGKVNYFMGKDPKKWRTNISTYAKVRYSEVYPGIDLVHYGNQE